MISLLSFILLEPDTYIYIMWGVLALLTVIVAIVCWRSRRRWLRLLLLLPLLFAWYAFLWGTYVGFGQLEVVRLELSFKDLPKAFDGYKIVQFGDAHVGTYIGGRRDILRRAIDSINAQHADAVVFTGDLQNKEPSEIEKMEPLLSRIKAKDGIFEKKTDSGENSEDEPDDSTATWSAEFVGTYVLKTIGGKTVKEYLEEIADLPEGESIEDYLSLFGIESFDELMVLELKAGGEATLTTSGDSDYPTWVKDGNKIVLSYEEEEEVLDVNGNELSIEIDGELFVLVRQ